MSKILIDRTDLIGYNKFSPHLDTYFNNIRITKRGLNANARR